MSSAKAVDMLARLVALTRDDEIDCAKFAEHLAAYVEKAEKAEKAEKSDELHQLMDHHRRLCGECDEATRILKRALEG